MASPSSTASGRAPYSDPYATAATSPPAGDEHGFLLPDPTGKRESYGDAHGEVPLPTLGYQPFTTSAPSFPTPQIQYQPAPSGGDEHVQYATYTAEPEPEKRWDANPQVAQKLEKFKSWTPLPLRTWFWVSYVVILVLGAIGLEVALHYTNKNDGWPIKHISAAEEGYLHYAYTFPSVAISMFIVSIWTSADMEIKKMQPYVDLLHGDSPPQRSLLLDYTRNSNFLVWTRALNNRHYVVTLASLMVLLTLCFSPLSASVFTVRDTWWGPPDSTVNSLAQIGLNQGASFQDLSAFVTAAGYASAKVLYGLGDPSFVHDGYTVAPFELPLDVSQNGTVYANTTAVKSDPGCQPASSIQSEGHDDTGYYTPDGYWSNSAVFQGCTFAWNVSRVATNLFGVNVLSDPSCAQLTQQPPQFQPLAFWFFTYYPTAMASISFCTPSISLWNVAVEVDLASGNLTSVTPLSQLQPGSGPGAQYAGNITGEPLDGRAYNGVKFNLTATVAGVDPFVEGRQNSTQLQLPAAVFQAAEQAGLTASFQNNAFVGLTQDVYQTYLNLVAKTVYFLDTPTPLTVSTNIVVQRLWMSAVAVHLITCALLILAFFGTIVQLLHRQDRRVLRLGSAPGTIASAVAIGARTHVGDALAGKHGEEDIMRALGNSKFRIDPETMKIIMQGEDGYEMATSPSARRTSVFGSMFGSPTQSRFARPPKSPLSANSTA